jgi:hypothetical protein
MTTLLYALRRVHADGGEEPVRKHLTFVDGWSVGQSAVHEDRNNALALYRVQRRLARFGSARLMQHAGTQHLPILLGPGS